MWLFFKISELFINHLKRQGTFLPSFRKPILFYFYFLGQRKVVFDFWRQVVHSIPDSNVYSPPSFFSICIAKSQLLTKCILKWYIKSFSWQTLAGSALLNGFPKKKKEKKKKKKERLPWLCLPSTSITAARHSDCYLFCHNYYHQTYMITELVILLIINSTNAVIHQQRLAALWRRGPHAHGESDLWGL